MSIEYILASIIQLILVIFALGVTYGKIKSRLDAADRWRSRMDTKIDNGNAPWLLKSEHVIEFKRLDDRFDFVEKQMDRNYDELQGLRKNISILISAKSRGYEDPNVNQ